MFKQRRCNSKRHNTHHHPNPRPLSHSSGESTPGTWGEAPRPKSCQACDTTEADAALYELRIHSLPTSIMQPGLRGHVLHAHKLRYHLAALLSSTIEIANMDSHRSEFPELWATAQELWAACERGAPKDPARSAQGLGRSRPSRTVRRSRQVRRLQRLLGDLLGVTRRRRRSGTRLVSKTLKLPPYSILGVHLGFKRCLVWHAKEWTCEKLLKTKCVSVQANCARNGHWIVVACNCQDDGFCQVAYITLDQHKTTALHPVMFTINVLPPSPLKTEGLQ